MFFCFFLHFVKLLPHRMKTNVLVTEQKANQMLCILSNKGLLIQYPA